MRRLRWLLDVGLGMVGTALLLAGLQLWQDHKWVQQLVAIEQARQAATAASRPLVEAPHGK